MKTKQYLEWKTNSNILLIEFLRQDLLLNKNT